jgi:vacuolar-type H+-ATPase subunit I/STV1
MRGVNMNYKFLILLICTYLLAFSINFMPALKHPDLDMGIFNILVTILFMSLLLMYSKKGSKNLKIFSIIGVISGVLVFVITTFEHALFGNVILDAVASFQYPFYLIFTTPLFGGNMIFDINYGTYSLLMSLFYGIVFGLTVYFKTNNAQVV